MTQFGETIPALPVADVRRGIDFYRSRLAFEEIFSEEGFGIVRRDFAELHLWEASDRSWQTQLDPERPVRSGAESFLAGTASCRIRVEGIDELYEHCTDEGIVHPNAPLGEQPWGTREFAVIDADNNLLTFFER